MALASVLIPILIVVAAALLLIWAAKTFFPEFAYPVRVVVGVIALILIIQKLLPLLH